MVRLTVGVLGLVLASCGVEQPASPIAARPAGLIPLAQVEQATMGPHLTEAVIVGDLIYVANSNDGIGIYELSDDGLSLAVAQPASVDRRCTSLASHPATRSLYCGAENGLGVRRLDLGDPLAPSSDGVNYNPPGSYLRISDLAVAGDQLLVAGFHDGLSTHLIGDDGQLSAAGEQPELGNLRKLDVDSEGRVWALTSDRGLLVLDRDPDQPGAWIERWQLELDGPALGLGVDGSRAAVGLGSAGLALVELDEATGLTATHLLHPPGVVTAADRLGDVAVAVTLLGVFTYDLRSVEAWPEDPRGEQPREAFDEGGARLSGYALGGAWSHPGVGAMLDAALFERDGELGLITVDWNWVARWGVEIDAFPAAVDLRRGEFVAAEAETVTVTAHNPTPFELRFGVLEIDADQWTTVEIGPRATKSISLDAAQFEIDTPILVPARVWDGDEVVATSSVTVLRRAPLADRPIATHGHPPAGAEFPTINLATGAPDMIVPLTVPTPGVEQRVVFYGLDCAAMWPEVDDLLWRVRAGRLTPDQVVLASHQDPWVDEAYARWGLADARWGYFQPDLLPAEIAELNPFDDLYDDGFVLHELPSAANHPTDYVVDADGIVRAVEREYRGEHELRAD